jgi:hypothetical protein
MKRTRACLILKLRNGTPRRSAHRYLLALTGISLSACGGSSSPTTISAGINASAVRGPVSKIVSLSGTAVVALFPDGQAFYSPDGFNLGGGGSTVPAYSGTLQVRDIVPVGSGGVDALLSDGSAFFSPDGLNLGGGGSTVAATPDRHAIASLTAVGSGVDAVRVKDSQVYFSPDGLNLSGGGKSTLIYPGGSSVLQVVPVGQEGAVVTLLSGGTALYSPDNRAIGGGGNTVPAAPRAYVVGLVPVGGGMLTEFGNGTVYLSPDGKDLAGGGGTIAVASWNTRYGNGPFPARDSAHGVEFLGKLWVSGGFADATKTDSCFSTCSFFDLWSSTDSLGASWNSAASFATATTPDPRDADPVVNNGVPDVLPPADFYDSYSAIVVWNEQLTAIGATTWRSADGVTWLRNNLATGAAVPGPLPVRATENTRAEILAGTLFLLQPDSGEVYRSTDANAAVWTDLGAIPGFTTRCGAAVFTLQGRIWIEGGGACDYSQTYHDIWSSADGVTWTQNATPAAWSARMWPCVATGGDGVMWLGAGYAPTDWTNTDGIVPRYGANHADIWYTKDGTLWKQLKADAGSGLPDDGKLEPRHAATCYVTRDSAASLSLVLIAGTGGSDPNDADAQVLNSIRTLSLPPAASLP